MVLWNTAKRSIIYIFVVLVALIALMPFYIMFVMGTYRSAELFRGLRLLPGNYLTNNLNTVFSTDYVTFYFNSFYVAVLATAIAVFTCAICGYAFAKFDFKGKTMLRNLILITMMIPMQLGIVAFVWQMNQFGWANTHLPLIIPPMANSFGVFWMMQSAKGSVPTECIESARIDGCNEFMIFIKIAMPCLRPALLSLSLLVFIGSWNSYLVPLVILSSTNLYTVPLGIAFLANAHQRDFAAQILGLSISTIPMILIFVLFSKNLVRGLTIGAVKG